MIRPLLGLLAAMLLLVGCAGATGEGRQVGFEAGDGSVVIVAVAERVAAPELSGTTLEGEPLSLADFSGKVIVLNVWGSWCAPCRSEAAELVSAAAERPEVQFVGINTRDLDPAPAKAFVRSFGITYPNLYDPDGSLLLNFDQLPPKAIPSTLIIDAEGRVSARILGEVSQSTLLGVLDDIEAST